MYQNKRHPGYGGLKMVYLAILQQCLLNVEKSTSFLNSCPYLSIKQSRACSNAQNSIMAKRIMMPRKAQLRVSFLKVAL